MPEIERLQEKDDDEILFVLNESFTHKEVPSEVPHRSDFRANLPIMWTREHDYGSRHLAIRENGKIVSLLGVYPLQTIVAGEKILLGTIGNVASLPKARGKGYMKQLVTEALKEAERQGFVAARLGGLRSRYNRYQFDHAGCNYVCSLTRRNVKEQPCVPKLSFWPLDAADGQAIAFARKCHRSSPVYVLRESDMDFYCTLKAWKSLPYMAKDESGEYAGYLSTSPDGTHIVEWGVKEGYTVVDLLSAYMAWRPEMMEIDFLLMPYDGPHLKAAFKCCESWHEEAASMFHIFQWDRFLYAYMKLASQMDGLADGRLTVAIEGWGSLQIEVVGNVPCVQRSDAVPEIVLTPLEAVNWFFGDLRAVQPISKSRPEASWFPLPLGWNGQDRV